MPESAASTLISDTQEFIPHVPLIFKAQHADAVVFSTGEEEQSRIVSKTEFNY